MLAFVFALGALAAAPLAVPFDSPVEALDVGALVDAPDGFDPDDGTVFAAASVDCTMPAAAVLVPLTGSTNANIAP